MDREGWDQRTDILVVVNPNSREVLWVPRDLYCTTVDNRINTAFKKGGHPLLHSSLAEHGIIVENSIIILRSAIEAALANLRITVPVEEHQKFYYPLAPQQAIEDGRKLVRFDPPEEILEGERIHQWIGARVPLEGNIDATLDLVRIRRQQTFLRRLLEEKFNFAAVPHQLMKISSPAAIGDVAQGRSNWRFHTVANLVPITLRKMHLLVKQDSILAASNGA